MRFRNAQWLFPLALTLHNLEEGLTYGAFTQQHPNAVPWQVSSAHFVFALVGITVLAFALTYASWRRGAQSLWGDLTFGSIVTLLVNVAIPHVPAAIRFGSYVPGLLSAVFVNLPVLAWLAWLALKQQYVSGPRALRFGLLTPVAIAVLTVSLLMI